MKKSILILFILFTSILSMADVKVYQETPEASKVNEAYATLFEKTTNKYEIVYKADKFTVEATMTVNGGEKLYAAKLRGIKDIMLAKVLNDAKGIIWENEHPVLNGIKTFTNSAVQTTLDIFTIARVGLGIISPELFAAVAAGKIAMELVDFFINVSPKNCWVPVQ